MPPLAFRKRLQNVPNTNPDPLPAAYDHNPPLFTLAQIQAIQAGNPRKEFELTATDNYREVVLARTGTLDRRRRRSLETLPSLASGWSLQAERRIEAGESFPNGRYAFPISNLSLFSF